VAFDIATAHLLRIGIAAHYFHVAADAATGRVAVPLLVRRSTLDFLEHRVIAVHSERALDCLEVSAVTVGRDLHAALDPARAIFHELFGPTRVTSAD